MDFTAHLALIGGLSKEGFLRLTTPILTNTVRLRKELLNASDLFAPLEHSYIYDLPR